MERRDYKVLRAIASHLLFDEVLNDNDLGENSIPFRALIGRISAKKNIPEDDVERCCKSLKD